MHRGIVLCLVFTICIAGLTPGAILAQSASPGGGQASNGQTGGQGIQSTIGGMTVGFAQEYGKTTIWLRLCADSPNFQMRAEQPGVWITEIYNRTDKTNGCSPASNSWWRMVYNATAGMQFNIYATASETWYSETAFMERAARTTCYVTGYGTGYCSPANISPISAPRGAIDTPAHGATVSGTISISGWAIDIGTFGGTGVDMVHIYNGATFLGAASYGSVRGDVAGAQGDSRYANSGWSMSLNTTTLPNGPVTLRVAYHSTVSGQWIWMERAVSVNNVAPPGEHWETRLRGAQENGKTTIWLQVCGVGANYRFRSLWLNTGQVLWDQTYGALNGCSPEYRAVIDAVSGDTFRFYSTVMNGALSDNDFLQRRRDACRVYSPGVIRCVAGDTPPPPPNANPVDPPDPPPPPLGTPQVPFFAQADDRWGARRLPCTCDPLPNTFHYCGCAVTSLAMILNYYGGDTDPGRLVTCAGKNACPMNWRATPPLGCGGGTAQLQADIRKSNWPNIWPRLQEELRTGPVILQLNDNKHPDWGHFVVALSGSGSNPADYRVHDPGLKEGRNMTLGAVLARGYHVEGMRIYRGSPSPRPVLLNIQDAPDHLPVVAAGEIITGTVALYRNTETMMTLELAAQSAGGAITDMQIWTDQNQVQVWQPFHLYVEMPLASGYYVRYRDAGGNMSAVVSASVPFVPPGIETTRYNVYLPLLSR